MRPAAALTSQRTRVLYSSGMLVRQSSPLGEGGRHVGGGYAAKADAVRPDDHLTGRSPYLEQATSSLVDKEINF
jgi:hypothetical protein